MTSDGASTTHDPEGTAELALAVVDRIPAMVAYWDATETCRFANEAYRRWFDRSRADLVGTTIQELLGPIYELNLPYIRAALRGQPQVFERSLQLADGFGHCGLRFLAHRHRVRHHCHPRPERQREARHAVVPIPEAEGRGGRLQRSRADGKAALR